VNNEGKGKRYGGRRRVGGGHNLGRGGNYGSSKSDKRDILGGDVRGDRTHNLEWSRSELQSRTYMRKTGTLDILIESKKRRYHSRASKKKQERANRVGDELMSSL